MNDTIMSTLSNRIHNDFYVGVVGSVRRGKSSFIKRFIEVKALPLIKDEFLYNKVMDEIPQSASGKQIMTVEPKFVPQTSLPLTINDDVSINLRLVDSVGYIIPSAIGHYDENGPRLVKTPWFEEAIPFKEAAMIGTKKVIQNHSNIGIFVTSDGSFGDFTREEYKLNEETIMNELLSLEKPFVVVLNSSLPNSSSCLSIKKEIEEKYDVSVIPINVLEMDDKGIDYILSEALNEFPIAELDIKMPSWLSMLDESNDLKKSINQTITSTIKTYKKFKHIDLIKEDLKKNPLFKEVKISEIEAGNGKATIKVLCDDNLYHEILDSLLGKRISSRGEFIQILQDFKIGKTEYDSIKVALEGVKKYGYGISVSDISDMKLEEPSLTKVGSRYGIKLKATAPSIHMVRVDVESSFEPIIGSKEQSQMIIESIKNNEDIWEMELFGQSLGEVIKGGINSKIHLLPETVKIKFQETLNKIVNSGSGGIIAIIL